jgi:hypothetical protein
MGRAFGFDVAPQGNNIYHLKIKSSGIRLGILRTSSEFKNYTNKIMFK